jgi:hypothetical protein
MNYQNPQKKVNNVNNVNIDKYSKEIDILSGQNLIYFIVFIVCIALSIAINNLKNEELNAATKENTNIHKVESSFNP